MLTLLRNFMYGRLATILSDILIYGTPLLILRIMKHRTRTSSAVP